MSVQIEIRGLDKLLAKLEPRHVQTALRTGMNRGLDIAQAAVKEYPPPHSGPGPGFVSARQRRWFFWALRMGHIHVPYRRTFKLRNQWTRSVQSLSNRFEGKLTSQTGYAKWVISKATQARIHQGRWWTLESMAPGLGFRIHKAFETTIENMLR